MILSHPFSPKITFRVISISDNIGKSKKLLTLIIIDYITGIWDLVAPHKVVKFRQNGIPFLLFWLQINITYSGNLVIKSADDTKRKGLITDSNEENYRMETDNIID